MSRPGVGKAYNTTFAPVESLDIFEGDQLQICITDEIKFEQRSSFQYNETSDIIIEIAPSLSLFTAPDLMLNVELQLTVEKTNENGTKEEVGVESSDTDITLSSMPLTSLFSDIQLRLNSVSTTSNTSLFPYIGYFHQTHLTPEDEYSLINGQSLAFNYEDLEETTSDDVNKDQTYIRKVLSNKKTALISGKIYLPLFLQKKAIINNVGITLILSQTSNKFRIMDKKNRNAKLTIKDIWVSGKRMQLNDHLLINMLQTLNEKNCIYPIQRWLVDETNISGETTHFSKNLTLVTSQVPDYVFLMCCSTEAVRGAYNKSPFVSEITDIDSAQIVLENKSFPVHPYNPSDPKGLVDAFFDYKNAIKHLVGQHNWVDLISYSDQFGVLAFKLSRSEEESENVGSLPRGGVATLEVVFKSKPSGVKTSPKTIILFYCYRNKITFNNTMIPSTDW